jgi:hypothetical protein
MAQRQQAWHLCVDTTMIQILTFFNLTDQSWSYRLYKQMDRLRSRRG